MLLQQLLYFYELTKHPSISSAATFLHTTQSNLSQTIINLENELDLILFFRSNKGVTLTPAGHDLLKHSKIILKNTNDIIELGQGKSQSFLNLCSYLFLINPKLLQRFHGIYDYRATLTVLELLKADILQSVAQMQSEIGLIQLTTTSKQNVTKLARSMDLELALLHTCQCHVYVRPDHPLTRQTRITSKDLTPYSLVFTPLLPDDPLPLKNVTFDDLSLTDFKHVVYLNSGHGIINFLHHSNAVYLAPNCATPTFIEAGLVSKPLANSKEAFEIYLVNLQKVPLSPEATLFVQLFKEQLATGT